MFRPNRNHLLIAAILLGTLAMGTSRADAWWGWGWGHSCRWYGGCYSPGYSYGSCYSSCCGPSYYSGDWYVGYRPGPVRRLLFGPYRWYWSGGPYYSYGCCSDVVYSAPPRAVEAARPATAPTLAPPEPQDDSQPTLAPENPGPNVPVPEPPEATSPTTGVAPPRNDGGRIDIFVPAEARVVINGLETKSTGQHREYVSYGLKAGLTYKYEIRAQIVRQGKRIEDTRTVYLRAGALERVAFSFEPKPGEAIASLW